jgi:hypothetical protein
MLEQSTT